MTSGNAKIDHVRGGQRGFSLVELMIAMVVTLLVSGAVFGLMTSGQTAFRREPELAERQQNIRMAMDLIMRDIAGAGMGMPTFMQTFTPGLDACSSCPDGGAPTGPDGPVTDELEIVTNDGSHENEPICGDPGVNANANMVRLVRGGGTLPQATPLLIIMADGTWTFRNLTQSTGNKNGETNCDAGTDHTQYDFNAGAADKTNPPMNIPGGLCKANSYGNVYGQSPCEPVQIGFAEMVHYRIRPGTDGVPELQRYSTASFASGFQTIARGVENLQVQYSLPDGTTSDDAPTVVANNYGSLITEVRVTLAARTYSGNLQGVSTSASGKTAVRGSLTSTGSARAALMALTQESPFPVSGPRWK